MIGVMMCFYEKSRDDGVSPVVGVMLMLVVTIIIAAVVSAYAGGLAKTSNEPPSVAMDVTIKNSGEWRNSYIQFDVKSVSAPFSSGDLKIVTSWASANGTAGGNTTMKGLNAPNTHTGSGGTSYQSPLGYGSGVANWKTTSPFPREQQFGNYTLTTGTTMKATAYGYTSYGAGYGVVTPYTYTDKGSYWITATDIDGMQAILGGNWYDLRAGDTVKVMVMHIPSGKMIFEKNVQVVK
jgi:archaeal type IV pilus assembly protein PilA